MKTEKKKALAPLDLCTLIAHGTASLLDVSEDAVETAILLRIGMKVFSEAHGLESSAAPLMVWIDSELESARRFAACGEDSAHLIPSDRLCSAPSPSAQVEAVMALFETAVQTESPDKRQALLETAQALADIGGLRDMLLTVSPSGSNFLSAADLRAELEDVRAALLAPESVMQSDTHSASP